MGGFPDHQTVFDPHAKRYAPYKPLQAPLDIVGKIIDYLIAPEHEENMCLSHAVLLVGDLAPLC